MTLFLNRTLQTVRNVSNILIVSLFFKYFKFSGRASRKEYFVFIILDFLVNSILKYEQSFLYHLIYVGIIFFPFLTITYRRLHDFNFSGIILLFILTTIILFEIYASNLTNYFIYMVEILLILIPGTSGPNKYGEEPSYD